MVLDSSEHLVALWANRLVQSVRANESLRNERTQRLHVQGRIDVLLVSGFRELLPKPRLGESRHVYY